MLPDLERRNVLLLQGPVGPFFRRLANHLQDHGASVTKINFNGADAFFFPGPRALEFRGMEAEWPEFLARVLSNRGIDTIMLFGDTRRHHEAAIAKAREMGIEVYVFEEGYVRPDYVTLEPWGVNARSTLPRNLEAFLKAGESDLPDPIAVKHAFAGLGWYSVVNAFMTTVAAPRFPHYRHHKDVHCVRQFFVWWRGALRKLWYGVKERQLLAHFSETHEGRYFLVPLQVYHDAQVLDSSYGSNEAFIRAVLESFAKHAPSEHLLVFKQHPLDRPYSDYTSYIAREAERLGIAQRTYYVHDLHLPTLLRAATGTVVLNSTVGCSSLHHGTPVKVLGRAVYDLPGLTNQLDLDDFWKEPGVVDGKVFRRFRAGLIAMCQINGSFYVDGGELLARDATPTRWSWDVGPTEWLECPPGE